MKKLFAVLLIAALMFSLTGCFGAPNNSSSDVTVTPHELDYYTKDFYGLQLYLVDHSLIPYVDLANYKPATNGEPATDADSGVRTRVFYDLLGADNGIRYTVSGNVIIEIYDFSSASSELAKKSLADIKDDGKITVEGSSVQMTGVISQSGKYVILYNANHDYEYSKITDVLKNW